MVGFSGGGGAAALLGCHEAGCGLSGKGVSQLAESLNPKAVAPSLQHLPQRHLSSRTDATMPPEISEGFCRAVTQPESCVVISGVPHGGRWQRYWDYNYFFGNP